jgi:hypothetical protein
MRPDEIHVDQVLAGKGSDADKIRKVLAINPTRREAETEVFRNGKSLGRSTLFLRTLAQWTSGEVPP